jgi:hypothetical protein
MDETVRLTYGELAIARGISLASARRMTLRRRWSKEVGNDGLTRVDVPAGEIASTDAPTGNGKDALTDAGPAVVRLDPATVQEVVDAVAAATAGDRAAEMQLVGVVARLGDELIIARQRAEQAEQRVRELEQRRKRWWRR